MVKWKQKGRDSKACQYYELTINEPLNLSERN